MFDPLFLIKDKGEQSLKKEDKDDLNERLVFLPTLMLLGILYCRSTREQRAEKLFELLDSEEADFIKPVDDTFRVFIPLLA